MLLFTNNHINCLDTTATAPHLPSRIETLTNFVDDLEELISTTDKLFVSKSKDLSGERIAQKECT